MRKRSFPILLAILPLGVSISLTSTGCKGKGSEAIAAVAPAARVAKVQRGSITHVLTLAGQFQPYQIVDVHPKVSGFIRTIYVDIGDKVRAGQTLAILEVPELNAQLAGTVFDVQMTKDQVTRAQNEVTRTESSYVAIHAENERLQQTAKKLPGLIAQQELDDANSKDLAAEAQIDAAKAALAAARQASEVAIQNHQRVQALENYTNVTAPLDGVIIWRYADTGALIQSGRDSNSADLPIVKLSQSDLLRLRCPVPENAIKFVRLGGTIQVNVDAMGRSFTGKIVRYTRNVNFETRTMETEVDVENKDLSIDPGMYAHMLLPLDAHENILTVPVEALTLNGNTDTVYVVDKDDRVHMRSVHVGIQGSQLAEITSGLQEGDRIIDGGQSKYQEGEEVTPQVIQTPASETMRAGGGVVDLQSEQGGSQ